MQIAAGDPQKKGVRKLQEQLDAEPVASPGLPECPEQLQGRARDAWEFLVRELEYMGLDRRPDALMLEGTCVTYAQAVDADTAIAAEGILIEEPITDKRGEVVGQKIKAHPAVAISSQAWRQVRAFCAEFGLSPVSRTRLAIERKDTGAELADLLSAPRPQRPVVQ